MTKYTPLLLAIAAFALCISIGLHFLGSDDGDKLWLLMAARKWLGGEKLYVDVFEINPPLIIWIDAIPVYLSMHLGFLNDVHFLILIGMLAVAGVISVCRTLIRWHPEFATARKQLEFCLLLATAFVTFQSPLFFFDREHIFLTLTFPYILRYMPSIAKAAVPRHIRIIIGILAGIGFCIKPHCAIVFAGLQLVYLLRGRSAAILFSMENMLIYCIATVYMASIFTFTPEYATTVFPMALATYSGVGKKMEGMAYLLLALLTAAIAFADFRPRHTSPYRRDIFYLLAVCLLMGAYGLANNGWAYTWVPLYGTVIVTTGWVLLDYIYLKNAHEANGLPYKSFTFGIRACMAAFAFNIAIVLLSAFLLIAGFGSSQDKQIITAAEAANGGPVTSFGTISLDFSIWTSFSRTTGAEWQTRFNQTWMLPKFFTSDSGFAQTHQWIFDYTANALAEDMKNHKPQLMFVDDLDYLPATHHPVDPIAFLSASPSFAKEWRHYRYANTIADPGEGKKHNLHGYYVYRRID